MKLAFFPILKKSLVILLLGITLSLSAQAAVVSDPALTKVQSTMLILQKKNLVSQTRNTFDTKNLIEGQLKHLENIDKALKTVNNRIKSVQSIKQIFDINIKMIKSSQSMVIDMASSNLTTEETQFYTNRIASTMQKANQVIELTDFILTSGLSKMSDAERIELLQMQSKEIQSSNDRLIIIQNEIEREKERNKTQSDLIDFLQN